MEASYIELSAIHYAAKYGREQALTLLLERKACIDVQNIYGQTPLHIDAHSGFRKLVLTLLMNKAGVDAKAGGENTPLHLAAMAGHEGVVSVLLDYGAKTDAMDNEGKYCTSCGSLIGEETSGTAFN